MKKLLKLLLGTGLYVLEQSDSTTKKMRDRAAGELNDLRDAAQEKYEVAVDRVTKASRAIRGEDSAILGNALRFAAGIGVGVGLGLMLAPASGEETRSLLADKVQDLGGKVRRQFSSEEPLAAGRNG
jgi:ElaB/YqjD/DUF883 family membrane-anchored ribosome-binding protein